MSQIKILDYWTQYALNAIWKEWVQECIKINDIETRKTNDNYYNNDTGNTTFNNSENCDNSLNSIIVNN